MELIDFPLIGRSFTWYHAGNGSMSRLDRILLSREWVSCRPNMSQWALSKDFSDHCTILLRVKSLVKGPIPFKFNNCWLQHCDLRELILNCWNSPMDAGKKAFLVKEKLNRLNEALKDWNNVSFGCLDTKLADLVSDIQAIDLVGDSSNLDVTLLSHRKELLVDWWKTSTWKDNLLRQKSRNLWLKEGDANSSFFHACINNRRRRNNVLGLSVDGVWVEGDNLIRSSVSNYFKDSFTQLPSVFPTLDGAIINCLSQSQSIILDAKFSEVEIKAAASSCVGDKCPGPDGFNFRFFHAFWDIIKHDIFLFIQEFYGFGKLPKGLNSSFIALIPKCKSPNMIKDFIPISLVRSLYKILAKVLASRLKLVMGSINSSSQSTFNKDRNILNATVVINETIHSAKMGKDWCFILKFYFEKAYDSVSWSFLDYMLCRFGFSTRWRKWISGCLSSVSMFVLINGTPSEFFRFQKISDRLILWLLSFSS
ncbi:unnamed protein product [Lupinus luteus]|uniref:Reverse transcriptase domain-containing protein n=1 Tax=Lupinus luteus TaxID=3873 RepID=A0AAV1VQV8_LUPLU